MALNINGTTGISGVDGSVSAPAVTGTDSNTGITFPAADTIKFSTNGVERMSITNSGVTGTGVGGKILQVVSGTTTTQAYLSNSTTLTDTGLTATITPASGTKILVIINQPFYVGSYNFAGDSYGRIKVLRDSTSLSEQLLGHDSVSAGWFEMWSNFTFTYLDTHGANGSTAVTYKTQFSGKSSTEVYVQRGSEGYSQRANINLLEVQ